MRFFDFEVTPNWWLCVFGDLPDDFSKVNESTKDTFTYVDSAMPDARDRLLQLFREEGYVLSGYNIKHYDLIIANAIYQGFTPQQVKIINDIIINPSCAWSTKEHCRLAPFAKKKLYSIAYQDLMDDSDGSLKQKEAILGLNILESYVDFNTENMSEEDKADMLYYCKQDVYAAMMFYIKVVHPYTLTKLNMGKHFNISEETCRKNTNPNLVGIALGAKRTHYDDAERMDIELPKKIKEYCYENVPSKILEHILNSTKPLTVKLYNNIVSYGNGGIHSTFDLGNTKDTGIYVESNDEWILVNIDAESYYPSMMIQFNTISRSIKNPQVFIDIYNERMEIKHKENMTPEDNAAQMADKLVLNSTFGASGCKWLDLYDPYQCTKTCRIGQIFLTALACKLYKNVNGLQIIQTNTDGILAYFRKKDLPIVDKLMKEWSTISGINMEKDYVSKIWQKNVNNYMLVKDNGKIKTRGIWLNCDIINPGYVTLSPLNSYVCQKAAIEWLLNGKDVIKTIVENVDLQDFAIVCTKGPTYRGVVQRFEDGSEKELFKCNRVYASKDKSLGMIYKYKMYKGDISYAKIPNIPENCRLINEDFSTYNFNEIKKDLDYMFYIERAMEVLDVDWYTLNNYGEIISINNFDYN